MADDRMKNIAGLFRNSRTRFVVLSTLTVLFIAIIVGFVVMRHRFSAENPAPQVTRAPENIQSVPFDAPSAEYAKLQEKQNVEKAQTAEQQGSSAVPTIIRTTKEPVNVVTPPEGSQAGLEFTTLNQQAETGFSPKKLDLGDKQAVNCPTANNLGTPVYDENGRLIGYVGADGKVRDLNGNIIGTVDKDGVVRDLSGKVIGRAGAYLPGTPVYDSNGNLIGYVGADGKVRDITGKIVGTLGPDGLVRDANGKVIGSLGKPVYDANGNLIGYVGPDGKVRDANGNIIGTADADGTVRDLNGNIVGKAGATPPGTPMYDSNGHLIGYLGPDGKVRDANGNVIGTLGLDGLVRDANGNVIGGVKKSPEKAAASQTNSASLSAVGPSLGIAAPSNTSTGQSAALQQQIQMLNSQQLEQAVQQRQQAMSTQAGQLLAAWASPTQTLVQSDEAQTNAGGTTTASSGNTASASSTSAAGGGNVPLFKAGTILFATIDTAINSDEPGPVMATIVTGQYKGAKLLGTLTNQGKAVMLTFNTMSLSDYPKSIAINAVAIDQNTARTALSTYTDNHYLLRYGSVFAASFLQGYGNAFTQSGSATSTNGLTTQTTTPDLSPQAKFFAALGNVGTQFNTTLANVVNTPPTVHVASGTAVGILFLADVQQPS